MPDQETNWAESYNILAEDYDRLSAYADLRDCRIQSLQTFALPLVFFAGVLIGIAAVAL